jgi:hypothetical protein
MAREPILMAVCGKKGVGKSFTTMKYLREYVRGNPEKGIPGRKVLIFDVNNEYSDKSKFPDIRALALKDVELFSARSIPEIRRVRPFFDNGVKMTLNDMANVLQWLVTKFFDGLLLIEDINKYVSDSMPSDLIGAICTNRHSGVDIIMHYQSIGRLTPKVWQNINVLRMHKNTDSVSKHRNKFEDKFEYLRLAEKIIYEEYISGNHRFYLFVDFDNEKVHAKVEQQRIQTAIAEYIAENPGMVNAYTNMLDKSGRAMYTRPKAVEMLEKRLYEQYFAA